MLAKLKLNALPLGLATLVAQSSPLIGVFVPALPEERAIQERYLAAYVEQLYLVGLPRGMTRKIRYWPSMVIELEIESVFVQTPGVGAGRRLEGAT